MSLDGLTSNVASNSSSLPSCFHTFHLEMHGQRHVRPFSEEALEFSEEKRVVFLKKVLFGLKKDLQTFSEEALESGTFSEEALEFSERETGRLERFVLIPFRASDGNPTGYANLILTQHPSRDYPFRLVLFLHRWMCVEILALPKMPP